jgi:tellurium resistance protein TerD
MELVKGANTTLGPADGPDAIRAVVVGVQWESGPLECELTGIVCDSDRKVPNDEHFLFWSNEKTPGDDVFLLQGRAPHRASGDRAQIVTDLSQLGDDVARVVVSLATVTEGATLSAVTSCRARVLDLSKGTELATFTLADLATVESCMILVELYRHSGSWKVRAVGQGYATGLAGLGRDHGVNVG